MTVQDAYDKLSGSIDEKIRKECEDVISSNPRYSFMYASNTYKRFPQAEDKIAKSAYAAAYAKNVIKGRWIEAEKYIVSSNYATDYAKSILQRRWREAEVALKNPLRAVKYWEAFYGTIGPQWEQGEKIFAKKLSVFYRYVMQKKIPYSRRNLVENKKFEQLLLSNSNNKSCAKYIFEYCSEILKARWIEAENIILSHPEYSIKYCNKFGLDLPIGMQNKTMMEVAFCNNKRSTKNQLKIKYLNKMNKKKKMVVDYLKSLLNQNEISEETTIKEILTR